MDQKDVPSQPHAPSETVGTGFNAVPSNSTNPFHDTNTAASLGATKAGTLEEFAQPRVGDVYVNDDASAPRASAADTLTGVSASSSISVHVY
jgi:uridylate kinase